MLRQIHAAAWFRSLNRAGNQLSMGAQCYSSSKGAPGGLNVPIRDCGNRHDQDQHQGNPQIPPQWINSQYRKVFGLVNYPVLQA
jgi:hypothetical protein